MNNGSIILNHPLWTKLLELNAVAARIFPASGDLGFGSLGLILHHEPAYYDYWCTPTNVLTFATTGGDGVHFSFLVDNNEVTENSPIAITVPAAFGGPNWIGGENLYDFLCFGFFRGYFAMEQVAYDLELTLRAFTDPTWQPTEDWHYSVGFSLDEEKTPVLEFLIKELALRPWPDSQRFGQLQERYANRLEIPDN